jgi:UPF0755 protein
MTNKGAQEGDTPKTSAPGAARAAKHPLPRKTLALMAAAGIITLFSGVLLAGFNFMKYRYVKVGPLEDARVFVVPSGAGLSAIAGKLEREGLIDSAFMLKLNAKVSKVGGNLKTGEYAVEAGASMRDIIDQFETGKTVLYPITLPEGLTSAQMMRIIEAAPTLTGDMPPMPAEGSLLPETYMHPKGMDRAALIAKMQLAQSQLLDNLWEGRAADLPIKSKAEAIILASVVEKETGIGSERDMVAGVFTNRLRRGIRLQSDPTIIYGVSKGEPLGRGIRRSEIDRKTDWNTYQIDGLPKTPICNPGKDAIAAVLNPTETDMIFFVADGTGGHAFAKTLAGHNRNVAKWRKIERENRRR